MLKRALAALVSMFVLVTVTFFLMHAVPGGPFAPEEKRNVDPKVLANIEAKYGLDKPVWEQYLVYMGRLLRGDLGDSFKRLNYTVNELVLGGLPVSAHVGLYAAVLALACGIPLGVLAALKRNTPLDWAAMIVATVGISLPTFIVALLLLYALVIKLGLLPTYGYGTPAQLVIPVLCLAFSPIAYITRLMRSSMLETQRQDYMRTARAKGVPEFWVIAKHGLRNSVLPVVTYLGPMMADLLTGSFVIERMFVIPGVGSYFVSAVSERDYSVILGMTIFYGAFIMGFTLLVDVAYAFIDPRVKFTGQARASSAAAAAA
jgi:oligopeptide transport system permease protein